MSEPIGGRVARKQLERAVHAAKAPLTVIAIEVQLAARRREITHALATLVEQQVERAVATLDELVCTPLSE